MGELQLAYQSPATEATLVVHLDTDQDTFIFKADLKKKQKTRREMLPTFSSIFAKCS